MVKWKIYRQSAIDIIGETLVELVEKQFQNTKKEINPGKLGDVLFKNKKIDAASKDLLNEAYSLLKQEEEARTIQAENTEDITTFAEEDEYFPEEQDLPKIKKYRLLEVIGQGGMGRVYKGIDPDLGRPVAIKQVLGAKDYQKQRFRREILLTAKLDQEHRVIRARAVDHDDQGNDYFVMDFVEGKELKEYIENVGRGRTYSLENIIEYLAEAIDAISTAHKKKIIHRDIKPDNIMLDRKNIKIMDWGLAKEMDDEEIDSEEEDLKSTDISRSATYPNLTQDGTIMGTPSYMSPEQAMNSKYADQKSDIYSFGAILYQILTGESPNKTNIKLKKNEELDVRKILINLIDLDKPALLPSKIAKNIPPELESICMKALAKDTKERYQTAEEFRDDLKAYLRGGVVKAHKYSTWKKTQMLIQKHTAAAASTFILITALGIGGVVYQNLQAGRARAEARAEKEGKEKAELNAELNKKRADEAEKKRKEAEKKNLEYIAEKYIIEGQAFARADKWTEAIELYNKAIEHIPRNHIFRANRAAAYRNLEIIEMDETKKKEYLRLADQDIIIAIEEKPQSAEFLRIHARIQEELGNLEEAEKIYDKAKSIEPTNLDLLADRSALQQTRKNWAGVIQTCNEMLEIYEKYRQAHVGLFSAYYETKNYEKAEKHARFLVDSRQLPDAWHYLSITLYQLAAKSDDNPSARIEYLKEAKWRIDTALEICSEMTLPDCEKWAQEIEKVYEHYVTQGK